MDCEVEVLAEEKDLTIKMLNNYEALQLQPEYYMTTDETMTEFVKPYLKRIRLLIDTLNARERTLFSIVSNIAEHQKEFFLESGSLQPFTLKELLKNWICMNRRYQEQFLTNHFDLKIGKFL